MHPVLGGLADKVLLFSAGGTVALHGVSLGPHQVIQLGQLHHKRIVVVLEERLGLQARCKDRLEMPSGLFL